MTAVPSRTRRRGATGLLVVVLSSLLVASTGALPAVASVEPTPAPEPTSSSEADSGSDATISSTEATELRDDLVQIYALQSEFLALTGSLDPAMPSVEDYRSDVDAASDAELAEVQRAVQDLPQFRQLPAMFETMITSLPAGAAEAVAFSATTTGEGSSGGSTVSSNRALPSFDVGDTGPVAKQPEASCEFDDIHPAAVFATQIILDVAVTAGELADLLYEKFANKDPLGNILYGIAFVAKSVAGVAAILTDTFAYMRTLNNDCSFENLYGFAENVDNTTVATFNLVGSLGEAITRIEGTSAETLLGVQGLDLDLTAFSTDVRDTLEQNLTALQSSIGGGTQLSLTSLQLLQAALQDGLVTLSDGVVAAKDELLTSDGATGSELEQMLTDSLTRTLAEIDRTTSEVRGNVDERTQLLMNAVEQDASSSRSEFQTDLRLSIEQAMTSGQRRTLLRLPAVKGGLLDAKPIGVQNVVNEGMKAMLEMGAAIEPSAVKSLNDGNTAISEGRWLAAYGHFESAYQGMINAR